MNQKLAPFFQDFQKSFAAQRVILTFHEYLDMIRAEPDRYLRNSPQYLSDMFDAFGRKNASGPFPHTTRFKLFDLGTMRTGPIVGGEVCQDEIYKILQFFKKVGSNTHLALLHGPNGSAKSSTIETIAQGMEQYSQTDEGAVYRFNWIFPVDKEAYPKDHVSKTIGFQNDMHDTKNGEISFARLEERRVAAKLSSDFKENPIFLLPKSMRESFLRSVFAAKWKKKEDEIKLSPHLLNHGLSKKNGAIFESLLNAYRGDISLVLRHIQVERFYFSRHYRVGIATVDPQMSIDGWEKQVTLDRNYGNLPSVLQNIDFYQSGGALVEANRGMLEFSDLLKRPVESFKYLLSVIEKSEVSLTSGTAALDIVFVGSTNDKHLDGFKTIPDFGSFKGRFELITVPYLLDPDLEEKIFSRDMAVLETIKPIAPHAISLLCLWGVLTRLRRPDPNLYPQETQALIGRLEPIDKLSLYRKQSLQPHFSRSEEQKLRDVRMSLWYEFQKTINYEGRYGASPRELRMVLFRSAQNSQRKSLTPMCLFSEIESFMRDQSVYEFLQIEPQGHYHDVDHFLQEIKNKFAKTFDEELVQSMSIAESSEYGVLFQRYITHLVAHIKKEKLWDEASQSQIEPSQKLLEDVERILDVSTNTEQHRNQVLSRLAAWKIEHPKEVLHLEHLFPEYLTLIREHFYKEKQVIILEKMKHMISWHRKEVLSIEESQEASSAYSRLLNNFHYTQDMAFDCLIWLLEFKRTREGHL